MTHRDRIDLARESIIGAAEDDYNHAAAGPLTTAAIDFVAALSADICPACHGLGLYDDGSGLGAVLPCPAFCRDGERRK